jgi:membrane protein YdbS with pleckstrin-like domain
VPFDRIQFVESRQGPLDRAFTLTQVIVYTAAGKAASIPGLDRATAETIREDLSNVAGATSV